MPSRRCKKSSAPSTLSRNSRFVKPRRHDPFERDPSASNRIWIAGKPMEEWLEGNVGSSRCCSVCGESECRTIEVSGTTFEAIPERLILKAALLAASDLVDATADHVA